MGTEHSAATSTGRAGRISRNLRRFLAFAALTPFVFAIAVRWVGSEPTPVQAGPDRPALAFRQYLVDLGKVPPSPVVGARFRFENRGKNPVRITDLKPSCGCLAPRLAKRDYAPGEVGEIILPVKTPNEAAGPREYTVAVHYTDPEPRVTRLSFRVTLPEKMVTIRPRSLAFYQFGTRSSTRDIYVTDYPKIGLKVVGAECPSKYVTVQTREPDFDEYGHPRHPIVVTVAGQVAPGRHRTVVTIRTDHPEYRKLQVPLIIMGPNPKTAQAAESRRSRRKSPQSR